MIKIQQISCVKLFLRIRHGILEPCTRLEEGMKVSEFVKRVIVPCVSALFLAILFRPLCMENGGCDYLKLWLFMGVPFGIFGDWHTGRIPSDCRYDEEYTGRMPGV